jgi:protein-tyrosine-phosphatase
MTTRVLFIADKDPVVARMAEALLRHMAGREFAVAAEGDASLPQEAAEALRRHGVAESDDLTGPTANPGTETWDYVISIGDGSSGKQHEASHHEQWNIPTVDGGASYDQVGAQLHDHIRQFMDHSGQESIRPLGVD